MPGNLGFLTVLDQSPCGLTGGYLVLNQAGRPLEFHCTVPLQPEKIQQILYGNTLQPFLCGERIAQTLIHRSKLPVFSILTNRADVLPVQSFVPTPIIYAFGRQTNQENQENQPNGEAEDSTPVVREISEASSEWLKTFGIDSTHLRMRVSGSEELSKIPAIPGFDTGRWREFRIGNRLIAVPSVEPSVDASAREELVAAMREFARTIDLLEPFDRIRLALDEAKNAA